MVCVERVTLLLTLVRPNKKEWKEYGAPTGGSAVFLFFIVTNVTIGLCRVILFGFLSRLKVYRKNTTWQRCILFSFVSSGSIHHPTDTNRDVFFQNPNKRCHHQNSTRKMESEGLIFLCLERPIMKSIINNHQKTKLYSTAVHHPHPSIETLIIIGFYPFTTEISAGATYRYHHFSSGCGGRIWILFFFSYHNFDLQRPKTKSVERIQRCRAVFLFIIVTNVIIGLLRVKPPCR